MPSSNKKQPQKMFDKLKPSLFQIVVLIGAILASYYIGSLSTQVRFYKENIDKQAVFGGGTPTGNQPNIPSNAPIGNPDVAKPTEADNIIGNPNAKYALVEYSDFDCPFCQKFHDTGNQFISQLGDEAMWVYRHFPLYGLHPNAEVKAIASECASVQGGDEAFWNYADTLFEDINKQFSSEDELNTYLIGVSDQNGLDTTMFANCLSNKDTMEKIGVDINTSQTAGVQGTPGNYLLNIETGDAVPLQGAVPLNVVIDALETIK